MFDFHQREISTFGGKLHARILEHCHVQRFDARNNPNQHFNLGSQLSQTLDVHHLHLASIGSNMYGVSQNGWLCKEGHSSITLMHSPLMYGDFFEHSPAQKMACRKRDIVRLIGPSQPFHARPETSVL